MSFETQSRRGRPKGSGIDDTATLARIGELMAADRELKPTTAIRLLGIEDPSAIRRLRDKLKAGSPAAELVAAEAVTKPQPPRTSRSLAAAVANDDGVIRETPRLRVVRPEDQEPTRSDSPHAGQTPAASLMAPLLSLWLDVGFRAASMAFQVQQTTMMQWARSPVIASLIRQHIAFNELAMAHLLPASPQARDKR